ncbi:DUF411 domain-containing protein [Aquifex sp.]
MKKFLLSLLLSPLFLFSHEITAFYNPKCSCCHKYFSILEEKGLKVKRVEVSYSKLMKKKEELGIPIDKRSCHTMVLKDGRFIEGHVPVEGIEALVKSKARGVYSPHGVLSGMGKEEKEFFLIE